MKSIKFTKMVASGNDFVIIEQRAKSKEQRAKSKEQRAKELARQICDRKFGVGADGLLILEKSSIADVKMRIFNANGSEAQMCGNGTGCVALYSARSQISIETKAGIIEAAVKGDEVKIKLTDPKDIKLDISLKINNRRLNVNFINTGVPHTVIFVEGLDNIDVFNLGRLIRYHRHFSPSGTNVDFVEALSNNTIKIRTYERGVEDETLACGTGAVAAALLSAIRYPCLSGRQALSAIHKINVITKSQETLKVYFKKSDNKFTPLETIGRRQKAMVSLTGFTNVWLEGKAEIVYKGEYYV